MISTHSMRAISYRAILLWLFIYLSPCHAETVFIGVPYHLEAKSIATDAWAELKGRVVAPPADVGSAALGRDFPDLAKFVSVMQSRDARKFAGIFDSASLPAGGGTPGSVATQYFQQWERIRNVRLEMALSAGQLTAYFLTADYGTSRIAPLLVYRRQAGLSKLIATDSTIEYHLLTTWSALLRDPSGKLKVLSQPDWRKISDRYSYDVVLRDNLTGNSPVKLHVSGAFKLTDQRALVVKEQLDRGRALLKAGKGEEFWRERVSPASARYIASAEAANPSGTSERKRFEQLFFLGRPLFVLDAGPLQVLYLGDDAEKRTAAVMFGMTEQGLRVINLGRATPLEGVFQNPQMYGLAHGQGARAGVAGQ